MTARQIDSQATPCLITVDGEVRWQLVKSVPGQDDSQATGQKKGISVSTYDDSQAKDASFMSSLEQERLRRNEELLRRLKM